MTKPVDLSALRPAAEHLLAHYDAANAADASIGRLPRFLDQRTKLVAELAGMSEFAARLRCGTSLMATCLAIDTHNGDRDFIEAAWPLITALVLADANAKDLAAVDGARAQVEAELKEARGEVAYLRAELARADGRATALLVELREAKAKVDSTKTWAERADGLAKTASQNHAKLVRELAEEKAENVRQKDEVREARGFLSETARRTHTESPSATDLTFRKGGLAVDIAAEVLLAELDDPRCVNMAHFAIAKKGETKAIVTVQRPTGKSAIELLREQNDRTTEAYQRINRLLLPCGRSRGTRTTR